MKGRDARRLLRQCRSGSLATCLAGTDGQPYVSLVTVACAMDGSPLFLLSELADHTRNLAADGRAALLLEAASGRANPQTGPRISLIGHVAVETAAAAKRRFLARHPAAHLYAGFTDFRVYRMTVERGHFVGGFARAAWLGHGDLILDGDLASWSEGEPAMLETLNGQAGLADRLAGSLSGRRGKGWYFASLDPEGCDLVCGARFARVAWPDTGPEQPMQPHDLLARLRAGA